MFCLAKPVYDFPVKLCIAFNFNPCRSSTQNIIHRWGEHFTKLHKDNFGLYGKPKRAYANRFNFTKSWQLATSKKLNFAQHAQLYINRIHDVMEKIYISLITSISPHQTWWSCTQEPWLTHLLTLAKFIHEIKYMKCVCFMTQKYRQQKLFKEPELALQNPYY